MRFSIKELEETYDIELDEVTKKLREHKEKTVLLQFPEGMKPYAIPILEELQERIPGIKANIYIGDCFGSCDIPETKAELLIQFGHAAWNYKYDGTSIERTKQKSLLKK